MEYSAIRYGRKWGIWSMSAHCVISYGYGLKEAMQIVHKLNMEENSK